MFETGSDFTANFSRAFAWWTRELAQCVPAILTQAFHASDNQLIVEMDGEKATLRHKHNKFDQTLGEIDLRSPPGEQQNAFTVLTQDIKMSRLEVVLQLPVADVLKKVVSLPGAAANNLYEVLGFEMDRKTPFHVAEVYYSGEVLSHNGGDGSIRVNLLVATKPVVDGVVATLHGWGIAPARVDVIGAPDGSQVDLLAGDLANGRRAGIDPAVVVLAVLAFGLVVGSLAVPVWKRDQALNTLTQQVVGAKAEAKMVQRLRGEIGDLLAGAEFLEKERARQVYVSQLLHEVTRLVPDNGWVTRLHLRDGKIRLTGFSEEASNLIARLENSVVLNDVKFVSPVTRDPRVGVDRFSLSATVQPSMANE